MSRPTPDSPSYDPAAEVVETVPRPDPDRHHQLRRRAAGRGSGRRPSTSPRCSTRSGSSRRLYESEPGRTVAGRPLGRDPAARTSAALLLHGHLDVVPAAAEDWQVDPFSGEIQDGYVWGRGAVDMKDFDAMLLSVVRARTRAGRGAGAADRAVLHRRRGGRRPQGRRRSSSRSTARSSRAAPRRSARSAASARPSAGSGSTSSRPPRRAWPGCG